MVATGGVGGVIGDSWVEVTGLGFSLEQPTTNEQAIKSAAKTSALVVSRFKFDLSLATELTVDGMVRNGVAQNSLIRVMVGHLLLRSSA
jgi:hypothetical protein